MLHRGKKWAKILSHWVTSFRRWVTFVSNVLKDALLVTDYAQVLSGSQSAR